jgi:hypothetical protein
MSFPLIKLQHLRTDLGTVAASATDNGADIAIAAGQSLLWFKTVVTCTTPAVDTTLQVQIGVFNDSQTIDHTMSCDSTGEHHVYEFEVPGFCYLQTADAATELNVDITAGSGSDLLNVNVNTEYLLVPA